MQCIKTQSKSWRRYYDKGSEKLKNKRLVKQFDTYKTESLKPKGKIKKVRVEALRAGFKQCYKLKNFQTIVRVGDRIPNKPLMEDEVLFQFYDIASLRVQSA